MMSASQLTHPLFHGRLEFVCKRSEGPWRISGFLKHLFFSIFMKSPPLLLNYVSLAASISMATPLHHHLKLYEDTPRIGRTLFWVTTPLRQSGLTSRQLMSQLFIYLTSHSAPSSILRMFSPWSAMYRKL